MLSCMSMRMTPSTSCDRCNVAMLAIGLDTAVIVSSVSVGLCTFKYTAADVVRRVLRVQTSEISSVVSDAVSRLQDGVEIKNKEDNRKKRAAFIGHVTHKTLIAALNALSHGCGSRVQVIMPHLSRK